MASFGLQQYISEKGMLILQAPSFDFDSFPQLGETLVDLLSASVVEKQTDADVHSWLIDFEGCQLFLRAEHYSECMWLEALDVTRSREELDYLAQLFERGF